VIDGKDLPLLFPFVGLGTRVTSTQLGHLRNILLRSTNHRSPVL